MGVLPVTVLYSIRRSEQIWESVTSDGVHPEELIYAFILLFQVVVLLEELVGLQVLSVPVRAADGVNKYLQNIQMVLVYFLHSFAKVGIL